MTGKPRTRAPRLDAQRNFAAILVAAQDCLAADPQATMSRIAEVAGVGRVTLYGHFGTRADLVDAVFSDVIEQAAELLSGVDTQGEPVAALTRLVQASWRVVHRFRAVLTAAEAELPPARVREHHDEHLARVTQLIERGQRCGDFRDDLPTAWLVTVTYTLMHAAAHHFGPGEMVAEEGERVVAATILAALVPRGSADADEPETIA